MDFSWRRGDQGMIIKLDMANAFDRVRHSFLEKVFCKLGMDATFIRWINICIASPWMTLLVNDRVAGFFKASKGLPQGCSLSPFLYIIMANALSRSLESERASLNLSGIRF